MGLLPLPPLDRLQLEEHGLPLVGISRRELKAEIFPFLSHISKNASFILEAIPGAPGGGKASRRQSFCLGNTSRQKKEEEKGTKRR